MTHGTIKSLIEAAINSCDAIEIGSFFSKVNFKNTLSSSLNKPLFTPQDQISSPRVEKLRQTIQPPPSDVFTFSMPFVYPTAEDVYQKEHAVLCNRKTPPSCTQAFEDNFESVNLTQMLDETRLYNFPNQDHSEPIITNSSQNSQLKSASTFFADNCLKEPNLASENTNLVSEPPNNSDASLLHIETEISRYHGSTKSNMNSGLQPRSTTINVYSPLKDITRENINYSPSVTGFCTGKGASISISSAAALQRAKGLVAECFNEPSGEHMNRDLESICATSAPQDPISDVCSPKVGILIASTGQSSKLSDTCHVLPSDKGNAWVTGSLVADGDARSGLKSPDSRHFAKSLPEASAHEPVSGSSPKRIQPCVAPQLLPCSESLGSFKNTGFQTGKGASIAVKSTEAIIRAKAIFAYCLDEPASELVKIPVHESSQNNLPVLKEPQLVPDKNQAAPSDSLHWAKNIPGASAHEPVLRSIPKRIQPCAAPQSLPCSASFGSLKSTGFQTGKGASIAVKSTEVLMRAKALFADCLNESVSKMDKIPVNENSRNRLPVLQEPQLAPDKSKVLCATGLVKQKAGTTLLTTKQLCRPTDLVEDSLIEPVGMQITEFISPRKTSKADAKEPTVVKCHPLQDASSAPIITGFSTGKGAPISITSAEVPQRVRELLKECLDEPLVDGCQQRNENYMTSPALNVSDANNNRVFDSYSNDKGSAISHSSVDAGSHPKYLVKEHVRDSPTEKATRRVDAQPNAENEVKVSHLRDLSNRNTGFSNGSGGSSPVVSDTRARPSSTEEANLSDFVFTDKLITLHGIDAPPSPNSKLERAPQNARKFHSVLPSNTPSQGPISSAVLCAEAVEPSLNMNCRSSSNGKIFIRAQPTVRSADAYTLSGTASLPPEEETGNEIPIRLQSPRFGYDEVSADVLEPISLVVDTNCGSLQRNVTIPKVTKDRALAREQQETMALAKFKSHTTPSPKTTRSRAAGRTPLVGSVATSRGQPQKVVREPTSPGLLWRLRHRLPTSSTFLNISCLTDEVSLPNARLALPDCLELPKDISSWSLSTAGYLLFRLDSPDSAEYPLSYNLGDSVEVIPNESGLAGVDEVERAFVCSPGVMAGLASRTWITHHFTQLAWRFGSCAILQPNCLRDSLAKFPVHAQSTLGPGGSTLLGCLLLHALLLELKYRYDRELEAVERSALHKILETDDTPAKRMVLCVSHLQPLQNAMYRGRLTDGWYHMDWLPDKVLAQLISRGKIRVGTKLVCAGAEAVQRPVGFDPPEGATGEVNKDADSHLFGHSSGLVLRLGANSTRIAHPTARLGYASSSGHMTSLCPIPLSSLYADGGPVSSILVLVQRRFQLQFMETRSEDSDGERKQRIFRDPRSEEAAAREHEKNCQLAFDKAAGDFSSPKRSKRPRRSQPTPDSLASLGLDGEALWNAINGAPDPDLAEASLSTVQRDAVLHFKEATMRELLAQTAPNREVTPLLRLHLAGLHPKDVERKFELPLTLWNPSEEMLSTLKEGAVVQFFRLQISTTRVNDPFAPTVTTVPASAKASSTEFPASAQLLSLSGGRSTVFRLVPKKATLKFSSVRTIQGPSVSQSVADLVEKVYRPRVVHSLTDLFKFAPNSSTSGPAGSSVTDFSALIVGVHKTSMPSLNSTEATSSDLAIVYLAHHTEEDSSSMGVLRVWGGLERYCLAGVLRLSNKVTFTDVQVRGCCIFRPQHDYFPDSCELRLVNLNYTAASYAVAASPSSVRQLRTPRQESSDFTAFMRACADAHFEKSFSRSFISTPVVKPSPITTSRTISASTPIQRRGGNLQAPSSATTAVRSLSTLLRGDLVSAASAATPCKLLAPETTPSTVSVTPKPCRTRTGLSRPRSSRQTLPPTPCSAASALSMATPAGSTSRRTRLRASQEAVKSIPPTVMSPGPANKEPVEQTPVRRATKQQEAPASPPSQSSPSFLGSSFTVEALDDLNVSIADLVKTRRRSSSHLASPQSAQSSQLSSHPRTPRSRRTPASRMTSPSVDAV